MNDQAIEQEIVAKGLTAPRITPADIDANIASEHYFVGGDGIYGAAHKAGDHEVQQFPQSLDLLTFCVLVLRNGFTVTGESACASPENFSAEIGQKIARQNAVQKIWPLMGYALKDRLAAEANVRQRPEPPPADNAYVAPGCEKFPESFTFDQFVQYGRNHAANLVNGMPWSFNFHGHPVTHECDELYLIMGKPGQDIRFTPGEVLLLCPDGTLETRLTPGVGG